MFKMMADDPLLREMDIHDFLSYLRATNWQQVEYPGNRLIVYEKYENEETDPHVLALPKYARYRDAYSRLADAINILAEIEDTSPHMVTQKILSLDSDILYIRMQLPKARLLSLEKAVETVRALRDLIAFSACMEKQRKPFFYQPLPVGQRLAQRCRFGYSVAGMFGFRLEVPVFETALARRAVERIVRGLIMARQAEQEGTPALISQDFETGLNGNMCSALAEMATNLGNVEYTISWSPRLPASDDLSEIKTILLPQSAAYTLAEAATKLKRQVRGAPLRMNRRHTLTERDLSPVLNGVSPYLPDFALLNSFDLSHSDREASNGDSEGQSSRTPFRGAMQGAKAVADWLLPGSAA